MLIVKQSLNFNKKTCAKNAMTLAPSRLVLISNLSGFLLSFFWWIAKCTGQTFTPPQDASTREIDGIKHIRLVSPWIMEWSLSQFETWVYGVNDSRTLHLERFPTPYEPGRQQVNRIVCEAPFSWVVLWDESSHEGLWYWSESEALLERRSDRISIAFPNGALVLASKVKSVTDGFKLWELNAIEPIVWSGLTGTWRRVTVLRTPEHNRWDIIHDQKRKMVFRFSSKSECLISTDLNQDGHVDDDEVLRPTYKLVDLNGDGRFLEGSLLVGGRVETDCYYYNLEGSVNGELWTHRVTAYDLDGDGQQDVTERITLLDFHDRGEGGWGTAANREGLMINYGRRPFSEVLRIDVENGTIRQHPIMYDYYFFAGDSCATTAHYIDPDHIWRCGEEHLEYDDFHPTGEAHLWTWAGGLRRVVLGGLGGMGKWKLGVEFSAAIDAVLPSRLVEWQTPWGQKLRMVSWLAPPEWTGKPLSNADAWNWAIQQKMASTTTIEPNDVPGELSFEAYLGGSCERSRLEYSSPGKTTFVFYYSPLLGGLHHKGAHRGHTRDKKLLYYDRDLDGVMDTYAWDVDGDHSYARRLWYDRQTGTVTVLDRGELYQWTEKLDFPDATMALADFDRLDELYRRGNGDRAVVMGSVPNTAQRLHHKVRTVAMDVSWNDTTTEEGSGFLARVLAPHLVRTLTIHHPISDDQLKDIDLLILTKVEPHEVPTIAQWVQAGNTLVLSLKQSGFWEELECGVGEKQVNLDFRMLRIPDQAHIQNDIVGEKFPLAANYITNFSGRTSWLTNLNYLAVLGPSVKAKEALLRRGEDVLVGRTSVGRGQIIVIGGGLLENRFCAPPLHHYFIRQGEPHQDNVVLIERIFGELLEVEPPPPVLREPTGDTAPRNAEIPWRKVTISSNVMRVDVYPELGGRLLWLGRVDSGINQLRVEDSWYLAGPPLTLNPYRPFRNYGGIWDVGSPGWPGLHFFDREYVTKRVSEPRAEYLIVTATADGVEVVREMILPHDESAVVFNIKQRNVTNRPKRLMIRMQAEFQVGENSADIYWPKGGTIHRLRYVLGQEEARGFKPFEGTWAAAVDLTNHEVILQRVDQTLRPRLFFWAGAGKWENWMGYPIEVPDDYWGFYSLQFWHQPRVVSPKDSIEASIRMEVYRGFTGVDLVGDDYIAELVLEQTDTDLLILPRLATPTGESSLSFQVKVDGPIGFAPTIRKFEHQSEVPGVARQWTWLIKTTELPHGQYKISLVGPDGQTATRSVFLAR